VRQWEIVQMINKTCVFVVSILSLSACSGSGTAGFSSDFTALVSEADRLATRLDTLDPTLTVPGSGGGTYEGVIVLADDISTSTTGTIGSVNLTANFNAPNSISGTAGTFFSTAVNSVGDPVGTGTPVAGALSFSGTDLDTVFFLDVAGNVTVDGVSRPLDDTMLAAFAGPNAEMLSAVGVDLAAGLGYDLDVFLVAD
jgi:hypothetical protein